MNGTMLVTNTYDDYTTAICAGGWAGGADGAGAPRRHELRSGICVPGERDGTEVVGGAQCMGYETTGVATGTMTGRDIRDSDAIERHELLAAGGVDAGRKCESGNDVDVYGSWAVTSVTGPNGANGTTTYDYGRP